MKPAKGELKQQHRYMMQSSFSSLRSVQAGEVF